MSIDHDPSRSRFRRSARVLFAVILIVALATLAVTIYAFVDRRGPPTATPGGADYMGGQQSQPQQ